MTYNSNDLPDGPLSKIFFFNNNIRYDLCILMFSDSSHLRDIIHFLRKYNNWFDLGIQLGLEPTTLQRIEIEYRQVKRCKTEMIQEWLNGDYHCDTDTPNKSSLMKALKNTLD